MGDYRGVRPAPTQQHIDAFITAVTQPGGPMQAIFKAEGIIAPRRGMCRPLLVIEKYVIHVS